MKKSQSRWFENLPGGSDGALRLYCFPYAGGSAQVFRGWQRHFTPQVSLSLASLPGRAARIGEPPFEQYKPLITALADAIIPEIPPAFAFWDIAWARSSALNLHVNFAVETNLLHLHCSFLDDARHRFPIPILLFSISQIRSS